MLSNLSSIDFQSTKIKRFSLYHDYFGLFSICSSFFHFISVVSRFLKSVRLSHENSIVNNKRRWHMKHTMRIDYSFAFHPKKSFYRSFFRSFPLFPYSLFHTSAVFIFLSIYSHTIVTLLKCAVLQATNNNNIHRNTRERKNEYSKNAEMDFPAMTSIVFEFIEPYRFSWISQ